MVLITAWLTILSVLGCSGQGATPRVDVRVVAMQDRACELCLYGPDNMVFDRAGNIYLTDSDQKAHSRVLKLSPQGKKLAEWRVFASVEGRRNGPEGIALDAEENVYVTDAGSSTVLKLSPDGKIVGKLGTPGMFRDLGHLAVGRSGEIYVAEGTPNSIHKFSPDGRELAVWHRDKGSEPNQWESPETIAVRPDETLAVEDWGNHRIEIISSQGKTLRAFGAKGDGPGQFISSAGLAVDGRGHVFVPDEQLHRVQEFDTDGNFVAMILNRSSAPLFEVGPTGIAIDHQGIFYSPDGLSIVKYSRDGKLLARWR